MAPFDSLITRCYIAFFLLPGFAGHSSWNIKSGLTGNFVVSGLSLSFYKGWKIPKNAGFPLRAKCRMSQTSTSERRPLASNDLGTSRRL